MTDEEYNHYIGRYYDQEFAAYEVEKKNSSDEALYDAILYDIDKLEKTHHIIHSPEFIENRKRRIVQLIAVEHDRVYDDEIAEVQRHIRKKQAEKEAEAEEAIWDNLSADEQADPANIEIKNRVLERKEVKNIERELARLDAEKEKEVNIRVNDAKLEIPVKTQRRRWWNRKKPM